MKIALPTRDNNIDSHFGHCEYFTIFTIDNKVIKDQEIISSPVGCGCKSDIAQTLSTIGVELMLAGNMGDGAVNVLKRSGIQVIRGCSGDVKEVATSWIEGKLIDSGIVCHEHDHEHGHGHNHGDGHNGGHNHGDGHVHNHNHGHECSH